MSFQRPIVIRIFDNGNQCDISRKRHVYQNVTVPIHGSISVVTMAKIKQFISNPPHHDLRVRNLTFKLRPKRSGFMLYQNCHFRWLVTMATELPNSSNIMLSNTLWSLAYT